MAYGESNGHVIDDLTWPRKDKVVTPIRIGPNILKTSWSCYFATIANYYSAVIVCCDAVRSAILATAWLLVIL